MKIKLVAADCDGTLINSEGILTPRTERAVRECLANDILFVMATGRPTFGVKWFADMFEEDLPLITYNGSAVTMSRSGTVIFTDMLSAELCSELIALGRERGAGIVTYADGRMYIAERSYLTDKYAEFYNLDPTACDIAPIIKNGATKILWFDDPKIIRSYYSDIQLHFGLRLNCFLSAPYMFEFVSPESSKGLALEILGKKLNIKPEEMMAIGDGFNDVSMLEYAGIGVAVANAAQGVKDMANAVTLSNDDDGAAAAIEKYVLEDKF